MGRAGLQPRRKSRLFLWALAPEAFRTGDEGRFTMTPEQAKFLTDIFLPMAQKESATTRRVLKAVPVGKDGYRPHPDSRSALELAWHIASSEVWFLDGFLTGQFEMEDDSMP